MAPDPKGLIYARSIHGAIRKFGPLSIYGLIDRTMLEEKQVRQGLRWSSRNHDWDLLANEIVGVTKDNVYFLSERNRDLDPYKSRRHRVCLGHLDGLWHLLTKEQEKYPSSDKAWTIQQVEHLRASLGTIEFGDDD